MFEDVDFGCLPGLVLEFPDSRRTAPLTSLLKRRFQIVVIAMIEYIAAQIENRDLKHALLD